MYQVGFHYRMLYKCDSFTVAKVISVFVKLYGNLSSDEESEDNMTGDFIFTMDFSFIYFFLFLRLTLNPLTWKIR